MPGSFQILRYKNLSNWSVAHLLANQFNYNEDFKLDRIGNFLLRNKTQIIIDDNTVYKRVTIRLYNKGVKLRDTEIGEKIGTKKQFLIKQGQFLMSKIDARNGAFGIATEELDGAIITADFFAYDIDETKILPQFLVLLTTTKQFQRFAQSASSGTTGRQRMDEKKFLDVKIPLPSIEKQSEIITNYNRNVELIEKLNNEIERKTKLIYDELSEELGIAITSNVTRSLFKVIHFKNLKVWSVGDLIKNEGIKSIFSLCDLKDVAEIVMGNSPSSKLITNIAKGCKFIGGAADIKDGKVISHRYINSDTKVSKKGDILYLVRATIGNPIISDDSYYLGRGISAIRPNEKVIKSDFLLHVLKLIEESIVKMGTGSTFKQISKPILENIKIPVPTIEIQHKISTRIKNELSKVDILKQALLKNQVSGIELFEKAIFK